MKGSVGSASERPTDPALRALSRDIADAPVAQILRVVATVDMMISRGSADGLIAPLRRRLSLLRPPRPLRFARLLFHPLDPLIVPAPDWRTGDHTIPRTVLMPIAEHVRSAMGAAAAAIEAEVEGHTAEPDLVARLGRTLWPAAAEALAEAQQPANWGVTGLGNAAYRPLARIIGSLLRRAVAIEALCAETADGLLPPPPEPMAAMLRLVAAADPTALPSLIALILMRMPNALVAIHPVLNGAPAIQAAVDIAADRVLGQFDRDDAIEDRITAPGLTDAAAATRQIVNLLNQFDTDSVKPQRRTQMNNLRRRLEDGCKLRFATGLEQELLLPLQQLGPAPEPAAIEEFETVARGLRMLESEARCIGGSATYDMLLTKAAEAITLGAVAERMQRIDQLRLVEILAGSDAALAMLRSAPRQT